MIYDVRKSWSQEGKYDGPFVPVASIYLFYLPDKPISEGFPFFSGGGDHQRFIGFPSNLVQ